ncbi:hypothetical protein [Methylobrevis pamukkalensis]|uniref:DUF3329 domain-containing protein n=1 Tax=Methylobrevis pamukkalensis TaxID=1439726 RepID=A0A1E3GZH8_9HYPH|nr:hypothetical protein [Methylobrevis pamukkalensis]ODN69442.1 hypothetical protein A6302_03247 [Methylobrevis pamukkalensis]
MTADNQHPFFRPRGRRIAVVALCVVWAIVEWIGNQPFWGMLALAMAAYGYWTFFINYTPPEETASTVAPVESRASESSEPAVDPDPAAPVAGPGDDDRKV